MDDESNVFRDWKNSRSESLEKLERSSDISTIGDAKRSKQRIGVPDCFFDKALESFRVAKIEYPYSPACDFVLIRRANPATGGSDLPACSAEPVD